MCKITSNESRCRIPKKINNHNVYFEGHLSSGSICNLILKALELCNIKDNIQVMVDTDGLNSNNRNTDKYERKCENINRDKHKIYWNVFLRINKKRTYIGKRLDFIEAVLLKMSAERYYLGEIKTLYPNVSIKDVPEYKDNEEFRLGHKKRRYRK